MTRVTAARNRERGKEDEKDIARRLGGVRHWANSGGDEDVSHPFLSLQIKGGLRVMTQVVRDGVASAKAAAAGKNKLPVCVVVDRSGGRIQRFVVIELTDFASWNGLPGDLEEAA